MNIEIVEAYKIKLPNGNKYGYSVHVYLIDQEMDIRGIFVRKYKDKYFIALPSMSTVDPITKTLTRFNIIDFTNQEKKDNFINLVKEKIVKYVEEKEVKEISLQKKKTPMKPRKKPLPNKQQRSK